MKLTMSLTPRHPSPTTGTPRTNMRLQFLAAAILLSACVTGCRFDQDRHADGKDVKIATPFGGMPVKTNNEDVASGIGLPTYPGAVPVKNTKDNGDHRDAGSADVNMSFGNFQLRVKAITYHTDDSPQQVFAFYKKALGRYGDVLQCRNDRPVGTPVRTSDGLTCEGTGGHTDGDISVTASDSAKEGASPFDGGATIQLKAGSRKRQHIVDINPDHGGAKFGLVSLDLPLDFHPGNSGDRDDKQ